LPYQVSRQGPPLAVADVDGDGLEDVFVGGTEASPGRLFLQRRDGRFVEAPSQPWAADRDADDWGALFFDANGDGKPDLYVASGGYRIPAPNSVYQDRLYINQGHGRFVKDAAALPPMPTSKAAVVACDFNGDHRPDLFVGGRLTPRHYPLPARSYILRNDGGRFTDVTREMAPELLQPGGMVTAAVCTDFDGDGRMDLVTAGEWMPIQFYRNDGAHLRNVTASMHLPPMRGWWYSLAAGDFDHDGRVDLVAGNLGLNSSYTTSKESRFGVYAADFSGRGISDVVFTQEIGGTEYPYYGLALLGSTITQLALQYRTFKSFAEASVQQIFGSALKGAVHYQVDTFASTWLHNDGKGSFTPRQLPPLAQIAPIQCIVADDVDGDGNLDLIVAGNLYETEANTARADAGKGLWLEGDGHGGFTPVPPWRSGFLAPLDVRACALVHTASGKAVVVANNDGPLQLFALAPGKPPVQPRPAAATPAAARPTRR
ncbi:MAG TPA: VCBS repeat-containing protein, partial [Longimicrobiales bacterium]